MSSQPRSLIRLVRPSIETLPGYVDALRKGWSPDNVRGKAAADDQLRRIDKDAQAFTEALHDPEARGGPVTLPDGTKVPRLPGYVRWIFDTDFCGSIGFRWQPGTTSLPAHVLGHVGYAIVPWKRSHGYATQALALLLPEIATQGLTYVELTTDPDNIASQKVIIGNAGRLIERFAKPDAFGGGDGLRFRIQV